jgi:hypothetical protein
MQSFDMGIWCLMKWRYVDLSKTDFFFHSSLMPNTVKPRYNGPGSSRQNFALYNCDILKMLMD